MINSGYVRRVIRYRHKFLTKNRYDNKYLSKQLKAFDARRASLQLETALPLKRKEKGLYIEVFLARSKNKRKIFILTILADQLSAPWKGKISNSKTRIFLVHINCISAFDYFNRL